MLLIRLLRGAIPESNISYIIFGAVSYFEGPLSWMGADFSIGSKQEFKQLLLNLNWIDKNENSLEYNTMRSHLYKFPLESTEVKIITGKLYESREFPEGFLKE
jgi:hypothetical protein